MIDDDDIQSLIDTFQDIRTGDVINRVIYELAILKNRNSLYEVVLELIKKGYEVRFLHDEIADSMVMQIRKGEFADAYNILLSLITPYDVSEALIEMGENMDDAIEKAEKRED